MTGFPRFSLAAHEAKQDAIALDEVLAEAAKRGCGLVSVPTGRPKALLYASHSVPAGKVVYVHPLDAHAYPPADG